MNSKLKALTSHTRLLVLKVALRFCSHPLGVTLITPIVETLPVQRSPKPETRGFWYEAKVNLREAPTSEITLIQSLIYPPKPASTNHSSFVVVCRPLVDNAPDIKSADLVAASCTRKHPILIVHGLTLACTITVFADDLSTPSGKTEISGMSSSVTVKLMRIRRPFIEGDTFKIHVKLAA